jgi:hypothetical protein
MNAPKIIQVTPDLKIEQLVKEIIHTQEKQIILEVTAGSPLLANEINLRLLKFYVEEEEKDLTINSVDPAISSLAQRLGISTVRENRVGADHELPPHRKNEAETAAVPEPESPTVREKVPRGLLPVILILVFTIVLAVWWFIQPKAVVTVYPKIQKLNFPATVLISTAYQDENIPEGKIPAKILEKNSETSVQITASGRKMVGVAPATGRVTFINQTKQPVVVSKGSLVTGKGGARFLTGSNVLVPPKSTKVQDGIAVGEDYGRAEVDIVAEKKGTLGNQPAKSITRVEGKYQYLLKVTNVLPTKNGADQQVAVVTLEDVKRAESEAKRQMQLSGPDEISSLVSRDYLYLSDLAKLEILKIVSTPEIGGESEAVQTRIEYRGILLAPLMVGIHKYLGLQLEKNLPPDFQVQGDNIELVSTKVISTAENESRLELVGRGQVKGVLRQQKIRDLIIGKTLPQAKEILSKENEIDSFKIKITEGSKLPGFGFQIKVLLPAGAGRE